MGHGTVCFEGMVGIQPPFHDYAKHDLFDRPIYDAGMLRRKEGFRAVRESGSLQGSSSASPCLGYLEIRRSL